MFAVITAGTPTEVPELVIKEKKVVRTPFGEPSSPIVIGSIGSQEIAFISRNGVNMEIAPHEVNNRANIWALHEVGGSGVIAMAGAVTLTDDVAVGSIVLPKDIIDYTYGRESTFCGEAGRGLKYVDMTEPFDIGLQQIIISMGYGRGVYLRDDVIAGCVQGPRLPSMAEAQRYLRHGCQIIGMSSMPELPLSRELGLPYVMLCNVVGKLGEASSASFQNYHNNDTFRTMRQMLSDL